MGPPLYVRSVVDRNIGMRLMTVTCFDVTPSHLVVFQLTMPYNLLEKTCHLHFLHGPKFNPVQSVLDFW